LRRVVLALIFVLVAASAPEKDGGDWSCYRHDSLHTASSDESMAPPLERLWTIPLGGEATNETINVANMIYVGTDELYAFNRETAVQEWVFTCPGVITTTALGFEKSVIIGNSEGSVFCVDAINAKTRWFINDVGKILRGFVKNDTRCYFATLKGFVYSVDLITGTQKFKVNLGNPISTPPALQENRLFVSDDVGKLYCLSAVDGKLIWKNESLGEDLIGGITVDGDTLFYGSQDNNAYAINADNGSIIWSKRVDGYVPSPPLVMGGLLFVRSRQTMLWCYDKKSGETVWHFAHQPTKVEPIISGDYIYLGSNRRIVAISVLKRTEVWFYEFPDEQPTSLSMSDGRLIVGTSVGRIHCFKAGPKLAIDPATVEIEALTTDEHVSFEIEVKNNRVDNWYSILKGDITTTQDWMILPEPVFELQTHISIRLKVQIILDELDKVGTHKGQLVVKSNGGDFDIPITLRYIDPYPPKICINKESIDFGAVQKNFFKRTPLKVTNCGLSKLIISVDAQSVEGWLGIGETYAEVAPGSTEQIDIVAETQKLETEPGVDCRYTGVITIRSNTETAEISLPAQVRIYGIPIPTNIKLTVGSSKVQINGTARDFTPAVYITKGRTMVPLRLIAEAFYAKVDWDPDERSVTIRSCTSQSRFWIGKNTVEIIKIGSVEEQRVDVPPEISGGRTFIPIRAVSDILGGKTSWDGTTRTVSIIYSP